MFKILKSLAVIVAVAAIAGGGTYALWTDSAAITGSTFATGSMDLKIDQNPDGDENYDWVDNFTSPIQITGMKPGDSDGIIVDIKNIGDVDGIAKIMFSSSDTDAIMDLLNIKVTYDGDHNGTFETVVAQGPLAAWNNGNYRIMGEIAGTPNDNTLANRIGKIASVKIEWSLPASVGNETQNNEITVNTIFGLEQVQD